jgi:hypothetical protein
MDNLENQTPAHQELADLQSQCESLRHMVASVLLLLIVVSGTLTIFLLRQVNYSRQELDSIRPQVENMSAQYQKTVGPLLDDFVEKLKKYGQKHPDFAQILNQYGVKPGATGASPGGVPAPASKK